MLRAIDLSRAALLRQQQYLDATAHNIANTGAAGFKIEAVDLQSGENSAASADPAQATGTGTPPLTGHVQISRIFTQGPLRATGNPLDLAIEGEGFFVVQPPGGGAAYTRNGAFHTDDGGRLVDGGGNLVQPAITVPVGAINLRVAADGVVTAQVAGATQTLGQLQLARFINPNGLLGASDGLLTPTPASGLAQNVAPGAGGMGHIRQGALEGANTDIADLMTQLISAQRVYQFNTSAFHVSDEMLHIAGQLQGGGG